MGCRTQNCLPPFSACSACNTRIPAWPALCAWAALWSVPRHLPGLCPAVAWGTALPLCSPEHTSPAPHSLSAPVLLPSHSSGAAASHVPSWCQLCREVMASALKQHDTFWTGKAGKLWCVLWITPCLADEVSGWPSLKILWLKCCLRFPSEPAALIMRSWWEGQANFGSKWDKSGFNRNLVTLLKITSSVGGHLQLVDWQPAEAFVWAIIQAKVNFINPLFKQLVWSHRLVPVLENVRDTFWLDTSCTCIGKCRIISDMQAVFQPAELKIPWNGEHSERMLFAFADSSTEPNLLIFLEQITSPTQSVCLLGVLEESLLQSLSAPDICSHSYLN